MLLESSAGLSGHDFIGSKAMSGAGTGSRGEVSLMIGSAAHPAAWDAGAGAVWSPVDAGGFLQ